MQATGLSHLSGCSPEILGLTRTCLWGRVAMTIIYNNKVMLASTPCVIVIPFLGILRIISSVTRFGQLNHDFGR